ncbi:MAG: cofactor-independent phosphoglycerate mutase [Deltaproteobacteria bacterium]|nr:cofactor-independent phosphoglycerate mutase [Deltaproteobacteria bacterium]
MKYIVLLGDGMADRPLKEFGGKTPLQVAETPNMDRLAAGGEMGLVRTVPDSFTPGSDVANLSVLGYDPVRYFSGRAPLEAASMGVELGPADVAFRCNLVTLQDDKMADFSAGHISTGEAEGLIRAVDAELSDAEISFYPGVSYRHLMVWRGGKTGAVCTPPHDISGQPVREYLPRGTGSERLNDLMLCSRSVLADHPVNQNRVLHGDAPANSIWLWGQGNRPSLPTFQEKYGVTGGVISAVDLMKGIAIYAGLKAVHVPGATGYFDTNFRGKALAALDLLAEDDFVYLHVEAADEAGHIGDAGEKVRAIENFDQRVVGELLQGLPKLGDFRILLLPDHPTPIGIRTHSSDPAPFVLYDSRNIRESGRRYDEETAAKAGRLVDPGYQIMDLLIREV